MANVVSEPQVKLLADAAASPPEELRRAQRGTKTLWIIAGAGACLIAGLLGYRRFTANEQSTDDAMVDADVVPVAARVAGTVAALRVQDNARVKRGDLLLELDRAELSARLTQAEAELGAAQASARMAEAEQHVVEAGARGGLSASQAQVLTSRAQVSSAQAQIASARAQLARAEAEATLAQREVANAEQLYAADALARDRLDSARTAEHTADAGAAAARAQLTAAEQAQRVAESRVDEASGALDANRPIDAKIAAAAGAAQLARARVASAEANLELARLALSYTTLRSPVDGIVSKLGVREGQLLTLNQPVASIVPDASYVVANFKETQVGAMHTGQPVSIQVDAFPGREFHGAVASLAGGTGARFSVLAPDNASGNFVKVVQRVPVRIRWSELPGGVQLRAGMSATVTVRTEATR